MLRACFINASYIAAETDVTRKNKPIWSSAKSVRVLKNL